MSMATHHVTTKLFDGREELDAMGLRIPVMTNARPIGAGVELLQFKKSTESTKRAAAMG